MQWGSFIWRRQYPGWYCKFESFHFQVVDKASQEAPLWKILINQAWQKFIKVDKSWRFRIILQNKPHMTQRKCRWLKSRDMERCKLYLGLIYTKRTNLSRTIQLIYSPILLILKHGGVFVSNPTNSYDILYVSTSQFLWCQLFGNLLPSWLLLAETGQVQLQINRSFSMNRIWCFERT